MIIPFSNGPFSQWHKQKFTVAGVEYNCCEQYMMAQKALLFGDQDSYKKIMATTSPRTQKALGRKVKGFDETIWKQQRYNIVVAGNMAKFGQNANLKKKLLDTGDATLCEASPWDKIWGIGLKETDPKVQDVSKWQGLNLLGKALMEVRNNLK